MKKIVKNDLFDYPNRYIYQLKEGFKFSLDTILLAEFVKLSKKKKEILDMCAGNAAILLILSTKTSSKMVGFEIQKEIFNLGEMSIKENNLEEQITLINEDIKNIKQVLPKKQFDIIVCNPPYFKINPQNIINKNNVLALARHEIAITLEEIFMIASSCLKQNGDFYLVHQPSRLDEIILFADKYKIFVKELQLIVTKKNQPQIILIHCQKQKAYGIKFRNIIDVTNLKTYQNIFKKENI